MVDEAHVCRGVFGSHVAMVLRRLRRLIEHYGGTPRWCLASATVGNPGELASRLTGLDVEVVEGGSGPSGDKLFALWNPPIVDEETGRRRSALAEASWLMGRLVADDVRTIGFTRSRRAAELLAEFTRREVGDAARRSRIVSYRAGYLAEDRRAIERRLAEGDLLAVASTSALELGIDIGSLDAAVLTGYPGTRASMWQQAGRAGRRADGSLAMLVAQDDPLDQYLVHHPEDLFDKPAEAAVIDPENPYVLEPHLRCAARELPIADDDHAYFGPERHGRARADGRTGGAGAPPRRVARRRTGVAAPAGGRPGRRRHRLHDRERRHRRGDRDRRRTPRVRDAPSRRRLPAHGRAVPRHGARTSIEELAAVEAADPDYYTQARNVTDIEIVEGLEQAVLGDVDVSFGDVLVTDQVVGFVRKLVSTNEVVDEETLALPPQQLETRALLVHAPGAGDREGRRSRPGSSPARSTPRSMPRSA